MKIPSAITRESRFPTALMSPFTSLRAAAISPSAALFAHDQPATLLNRRFNFFILYSAFCRLSSICFYFFHNKARRPRQKAGTAPLCKTMMSDDKDLCRRVILRQNREVIDIPWGGIVAHCFNHPFGNFCKRIVRLILLQDLRRIRISFKIKENGKRCMI